MFLSNLSAKLNLNGTLSAPIPVKCGIRRGCPLSMLLFLIGKEPLTQKILSFTKIQGISFGTNSLKVSHYADGLTFLISFPDSFTPIREIIKEFSFFYILKINHSKTTIISNSPALLFHKENFFHVVNFLELTSLFKIKICQKIGILHSLSPLLYSCHPQS